MKSRLAILLASALAGCAAKSADPDDGAQPSLDAGPSTTPVGNPATKKDGAATPADKEKTDSAEPAPRLDAMASLGVDAASGSADTAVATDAAVTPSDAGAPANVQYTCTMIISLNVTEEWFREGFQGNYVSDDRWELKAIHAAFVDQWANPNHSNWNAANQSACKMNATNPDRVIFVPQLDPGIYLSAPQSRWESEIKKVVTNIQAKYTNVKRIELMTFVRSPDNKPCPGKSTENTVPANLDKAIEALAAASPQLIGIAPKLFLESCSQYTSPPHFNKAGGVYVAKQAGEHYAKQEKP